MKKNHDHKFAQEEAPKSKPDIASLPKMEMYAVLGLELSGQILKKIGEVEESVAILAAQKQREMPPVSETE